MDSSHELVDRMRCTSRRFRSERGIEAVEYALIGAIMAVLIVTAFSLLGDSVYSVFETVMTVINGVGTGLE